MQTESTSPFLDSLAAELVTELRVVLAGVVRISMSLPVVIVIARCPSQTIVRSWCVWVWVAVSVSVDVGFVVGVGVPVPVITRNRRASELATVVEAVQNSDPVTSSDDGSSTTGSGEFATASERDLQTRRYHWCTVNPHRSHECD